MNLSEALKTTIRPVKIGTQHGSGFIYIGVPEKALDYFRLTARWEGSPRWEEREVTDMYDADPIIEDAVIIIIEGWERGSRWFASDISPTSVNAKHIKQMAAKERLVPYKNAEGYDDPTVFHALLDLARKEAMANGCV